VLYILDGDIYFQSMSGMVQFMSSGINGNYQIPAFIVVGIPNTNRIRDLTPTELTDLPPGPVPPGLSETGGGDSFFRFLNTELFPRIESDYRTMPYRALAGHSIGGLIGLYALMTQEHMFNAYLIMDPSLWWENKMLVAMAEDHFPTLNESTSSVYISSASLMADENAPSMAVDAERFSTILEEAATRTGLRSYWDYLEREDHGSIPLLSLYNGLSFVFAGYKPSFREVVNDPQGIVSTYEQLSVRLGAEFLPPERVLILSALMALHQMGDPGKAIEILNITTALYPESYNAFNLLGTTYLSLGEKDLAASEFRRSLEQRPNNTEAVTQLAKLAEQ
jgi:predicted alpha/beta superfamily hydrolase